jgi:NADPH-dependent glutamate synthase beta subunit-like oxidoreductase/glutamate synthase domain-containing protein 3/NAD-dependent dihydropyrimidine dehydrogenase PreA subunit
MLYKPTIIISGLKDGVRADSRDLETTLQKAVEGGHRCIEVHAYGQHGIGGRLWKTGGNEELLIRVLGSSGQRIGSMGFPNTFIDVFGPASDDVGWLNAGAHIIVRGHAANGVGNAMAQGKIYIAGDIGARGMTMTKHNPRFEAPELWVLGSVGDSFAEFMAGGIAVICGHETHRFENILGYRPCVGMVGGKIYFRGAHQGFSEEDAKLAVPDDEEWQWLLSNIQPFLKTIGRTELYSVLTSDRGAWQILQARKPHEKVAQPARTMHQYCRNVWDHELGNGGLIGDLTDIPRAAIEVITTGDLRRYIPVWENDKYLPPCQANCPTGIPVQRRWELIRKGMMDEAVDLALAYTPFPASVCGYLCPNLCMQNCTRQTSKLPPVDITLLGKASLSAKSPKPAPKTGKKIAVVGGGVSGLSVAWQLWIRGHEPVIYEMREQLGGKLTSIIPESRIPNDVVEHELNRLAEQITHVHLNHPLHENEFLKLKDTYDFVVIAVGAQKPKMIPIPGNKRAVTALDFLRLSKMNKAQVGDNVVVIGAGNVGCDAATEAARLGAKEITLIDIQEPASYGKERKAAEEIGARFLWPRVAKAITTKGVELADGEFLPADTVIVSIGDQPDLDFLPENIATDRGFIVVDDRFRSSDPRVFAIGDAVRPGLLTEAIGAGRITAETIDDLLKGRHETYDKLPPITMDRVKLEYYDSRILAFDDYASCASQCASCGACRDCGLCETLCPRNAISRLLLEDSAFEYRVDDEKCIGCGFCAGACPTGVWRLVENNPLD